MSNQCRNKEERDARCRRAKRLMDDGGMSLTAAIKRAGIARNTFKKWLKENE